MDGSTGYIGVVSMIKKARPVLKNKSILRPVNSSLEDYEGPKISKRLISGRITSALLIDGCDFVLTNISGRGWDAWKAASGAGFKKALREHVERVCTMFQQTPRTVVVKNPRRAPGEIREDRLSGQISAIDAIMRVCTDVSREYASHMFMRVLEKDDRVTSIKSRIAYIQINGRGNITPVTDIATLMEVIWLLPCSASREFRRQSVETLCRVMGGDLSLCLQIEQNNMAWMSIDGGDVIQQALLKPVEYREDECSNRVRECSVRDALASLIGGEIEVPTPSGTIDVLSATEIIEIKYYRKWKNAIGQILSYGSHYPHLAKRVHLFAHVGDIDMRRYFELAKSVCDTLSIEVTFEETVIEEQELGADDDASTVVDGDTEAPRVKRARVGNEWDHLYYQRPFWFESATISEKSRSVSMMVRKSEIDLLKSCKAELESVARFDKSDEIEFADNIRAVQRRTMEADTVV